jgi:WD40 repeat protein
LCFFVGQVDLIGECISKIYCLCSALLATASFDTRVLLWSTITGELLKEFLHKTPPLSKIYAGGDNGSFVRSIVFSKYNHYLITTCDDKYEENQNQ